MNTVRQKKRGKIKKFMIVKLKGWKENTVKEPKKKETNIK